MEIIEKIKNLIGHFLGAIGFIVILTVVMGVVLFIGSNRGSRHKIGGEVKPYHLSGIYEVPQKAQLILLAIEQPLMPEFVNILLAKINAITHNLEGKQSVKGVFLQINSPGGTAGASQELFLTLKALAQQVPIVAHIGDFATSGAYYAASAVSPNIFALPSSIVGSVGVRVDVVSGHKAAEKLGFEKKIISSGHLKAPLDSWLPFNAEGEKEMQKIVDQIAEQFRNHVVESRGLSPEQEEMIKDGRIYTAQNAQEIGLNLVDGIMSRQEAEALLRSKAKVKDTEPLFKLEVIKEVHIGDFIGNLLDRLGASLETAFTKILKSTQNNLEVK